MLIAVLYQILIHPFLLPPALKCVPMHQFFRDQSINYFFNFLQYIYQCYIVAKLTDHWKIHVSSSQPCTDPTTLTIAYITILWLNKYSFIYNTYHIASSRLSNKPGYMILIGGPTQQNTPDHQPLAGYITTILASLTHYIIYIWVPICSMSIPILYPILIYPFLLLPAPKCLLM